MAVEHEAAALIALAARGAAGAARRVEDVHRAIADRSFRSPAAAVPRALHDAISGAAYTGVRAGCRLAGSATGAVAGRGRISGSPRGALVQSALNGMWGDLLAAEESPLAVRMALRRGGEDVDPAPASLRAAYPQATGRIVLFVHGLCEDENAWRLHARQRGGTYGTRLADLGATPAYVRFNSGLHISDNGRRLADLLERLVTGWPVAVRRLDLVGHSMGGLVCRSACHTGAGRGDRWIDAVRTTVTLGAPHHGAPLEQAANVAGWLLRRAPESAPLARVLEQRSSGIKDLRFGAICEDDWAGCDADALLDDRRAEVALHAGARHFAVAATLPARDHHPLARVLGDALVLVPSAHGIGRAGRRTGFADGDVRHVGGAHHLALLNHPQVEDLLLGWLRD